MKSKPLSRSSWKPSNLPWWQLRRVAAGEIGRGMYGSPDLRLWLLGASRVGSYGHACFDRGELADLLAKVNRTSGEVSTYGERGLRRLIAPLAQAELLSPASTSRCLVFPIEVLDAPRSRPRVTCPEHRCNAVWSTRQADWVLVKRDGSLDLDELSRHFESAEQI